MRFHSRLPFGVSEFVLTLTPGLDRVYVICRRDRRRDRRVGRVSPHGLVRGRGPNGGRVQHGRDLLPSNLCSTVRRRDAVQPIEPPRKAAESNSLHAICNASPRDTNNPLPTRTQELAFLAQPEPLGLAVAGQSRFQRKPAHS